MLHFYQTILTILRIAQIVISSFNLILSSQYLFGVFKIAVKQIDSIFFFPFSIIKAVC